MLNLVNLDKQTRQHMIQEIQRDSKSRTLYLSPRLLETAHEQYFKLLLESAENHNDAWFAQKLKPILKTQETRTNGKTGKMTTAAVPVTAAETLAEGEFNRFYMRAVCLRGISENIRHVTAYRAKQVANPRSESEERIGTEYPCETLLNDLRTSIGTDTALGLPPGPNSGLSIKL